MVTFTEEILNGKLHFWCCAGKHFMINYFMMKIPIILKLAHWFALKLMDWVLHEWDLCHERVRGGWHKSVKSFHFQENYWPETFDNLIEFLHCSRVLFIIFYLRGTWSQNFTPFPYFCWFYRERTLNKVFLLFGIFLRIYEVTSNSSSRVDIRLYFCFFLMFS